MSQVVSFASVFGAALALLTPVSVAAQNLPGGATPGGALPDVSEQRRPSAMQAPAIVVPPVLDRFEEDADDSPKIKVQKFHLMANRNRATAWHGGEYLADVEKQLAAAVQSQPAQGYTIGQIGALTKSIQDSLRNQGMILAQVFLPVQTVTDGTVYIEVMEGHVGRVVTSGNTRYKDAVLKKPLADLAGRAVDNEEIEQAVLLLRDYPGIAVAGVFSPGEQLGTTDLTLKVQGEDPVAFKITADNHGSEFTGENRVLASVALNNLLGRADRLSLSVLQTLNPSNGTYGSLNYKMPIFAPGTYLNVNYIQNAFDVGSDSQLGTNNLEGDTQVATVGVSRAILRSRESNISGIFNLVAKRASVDDTASNTSIGEDKLTMFDVGLDFDFIDRRFLGINNGYIGFTHGFSDLFGSLPEGNPGAELGSSRRNSVGTYAGGTFNKWHGQFSRLQKITDNSELLLRTAAQVSDDLIVSLEQFALGGPNSVRAYPPAEFLVDTGGFASLEFIVAAPGFADREAFRGFNWGDMLRLSAFYDYAGGYLSEPAFGEQKTRDLSGYGIGIDFRLPGTFWTRLDVAQAISKEAPSDGDDTQFYFSFNFSF